MGERSPAESPSDVGGPSRRVGARIAIGVAVVGALLVVAAVSSREARVITLADGHVRERHSVFGFVYKERSVDRLLGSVVMPPDFVASRELVIYSGRAFWEPRLIPSSYANRFWTEATVLREVLEFHGASEAEVQAAWRIAVDRAGRRESLGDLIEKWLGAP